MRRPEAKALCRGGLSLSTTANLELLDNHYRSFNDVDEGHRAQRAHFYA